MTMRAVIVVARGTFRNRPTRFRSREQQRNMRILLVTALVSTLASPAFGQQTLPVPAGLFAVGPSLKEAFKEQSPPKPIDKPKPPQGLYWDMTTERWEKLPPYPTGGFGMPPAELMHPFDGWVYLFRLTPNGPRRCLPDKLGCTWANWADGQVPADQCQIAIVSDQVLASNNSAFEYVFWHEIAHCNGWPADHTWPSTRAASQ